LAFGGIKELPIPAHVATGMVIAQPRSLGARPSEDQTGTFIVNVSEGHACHARLEGRACRVRHTRMDYPRLRIGPDKQVPPKGNLEAQDSKGHACRARENGMDCQTWRGGPDKQVPPRGGIDNPSNPNILEKRPCHAGGILVQVLNLPKIGYFHACSMSSRPEAVFLSRFVSMVQGGYGHGKETRSRRSSSRG